jgi:uncharacterized protein (DUF305 family)
MLKALFIAVGVSTLAAASILAAVPAGADDAMSKMDCSKAESMMGDAAKMGTTDTMSGDVDKDFMVVMMDHEKGTMMMMKIEAACGKNPKEKAMAQKGLTDEEARMQLFRKQGTSL